MRACLPRLSADLRVAPPVIGGATRQDSCRIGVAACSSTGVQKVLIHDAARPFVSADLISHVIAELERSEGVIPGLPVADTMKFAPGGLVERTVDRAEPVVGADAAGLRP